MKFQMASQKSDISGQLQGARMTQPIHSTGQQTELAAGIAPAAPPCPPPSAQDGLLGTCRHLSMPLVHLRKEGLSKATASTHTVQRHMGGGPPCGGSTTAVPPRGQVPSTLGMGSLTKHDTATHRWAPGSTSVRNTSRAGFLTAEQQVTGSGSCRQGGRQPLALAWPRPSLCFPDYT